MQEWYKVEVVGVTRVWHQKGLWILKMKEKGEKEVRIGAWCYVITKL
jgi:hypothetical protein